MCRPSFIRAGRVARGRRAGKDGYTMPEYNSQQMQNAGDSVDSRTIEQGYIDLLTGALQRFYQEDAKELFQGCPLDERTMVGCIARYVWCDRHRGIFGDLESDVDIEYNKYYGSETEIQDKIFAQEKSCCKEHDCDSYTHCWKVIEQRIEERKKHKSECHKSIDKKEYECKFRPDMIVHKRRSPEKMGNGMVVEFKKAISLKDLERAEFVFDFAKIRFCLCERRNFQYKVGVFVLLRPEIADVITFIKHANQESWSNDMFSVTLKGKTDFDGEDDIHKKLKELLKKESAK